MLKRIAIAALCSLLFFSSALSRNLGNIAITTAVTALTTAPVQVVGRGGVPPALSVQCKFAYGSGGTTASAWVQTSLDGTTWTDIANCSFTTASARSIYNLSGATPVTTIYPATDGTLASNTAKDGILGPLYRLKYTTTGTYAATTLAVDVNGAQLTTSP